MEHPHRPLPALSDEDISCFWKNVQIPENSPQSCWEWTGNLNNEYGYFRIGAKAFQSHRISYAICFKDPLDLEVCHTCDNRKCCNPSHLFSGTHADNMNDAKAKKRLGRRPGSKPKFPVPEGTDDLLSKLRKALSSDPRPSHEIGSQIGLNSVSVRRFKTNAQGLSAEMADRLADCLGYEIYLKKIKA